MTVTIRGPRLSVKTGHGRARKGAAVDAPASAATSTATKAAGITTIPAQRRARKGQLTGPVTPGPAAKPDLAAGATPAVKGAPAVKPARTAKPAESPSKAVAVAKPTAGKATATATRGAATATRGATRAARVGRRPRHYKVVLSGLDVMFPAAHAAVEVRAADHAQRRTALIVLACALAGLIILLVALAKAMVLLGAAANSFMS